MTDEPFVFGDDDPDDAWSRSDRVVEQLEVLARRVNWFVEHGVGELAERAQRVVDDLRFVRDRVQNRDIE